MNHFVFAAGSYCASRDCRGADEGRRLLCRLEPEFSVQDIPADKLTHVNYAFARIVDGQCALSDREGGARDKSVSWT